MISNKKTAYDALLVTIADYVTDRASFSTEAYHTASACFADALGCAILALRYPACTKLLGPIVPGTIVPNGVPIPGTTFVLDPIKAAFDIGTMIRWLDFNDTWLAAEWGHPSDNIGGILSVCDYVSRQRLTQGKQPLTVQDLLHAMIQAYEIQGVLALKNSFNRIGWDHVILVKIATAAVTADLLGATHQQVMDTVSNAWIDGGPLRTYRHAPNTGSRKSWAAGDATRRGVQLAWMTIQGEMGYPSALTAKKWGFYDSVLQGNPLILERGLGSYVMENILFKVAFPAEFHAQTAVEAALHLHSQIKDRLDKIENIEIITHESALRIIDKKGPLNNPADRDHCLQYMVAIALIYGCLTADHYEEDVAQDPRIDRLRSKMHLNEDKRYSEDYLHPDKRSIANAITIKFKNGQIIGPEVVEYPLGHRKRRLEGLPLLYDKCTQNLKGHYSPEKVGQLIGLFQDYERLAEMSVTDFMGMLQV